MLFVDFWRLRDTNDLQQFESFQQKFNLHSTSLVDVLVGRKKCLQKNPADAFNTSSYAHNRTQRHKLMVLSVVALIFYSIRGRRIWENRKALQTEPKSQMMFHAPSFTMWFVVSVSFWKRFGIFFHLHQSNVWTNVCNHPTFIPAPSIPLSFLEPSPTRSLKFITRTFFYTRQKHMHSSNVLLNSTQLTSHRTQCCRLGNIIVYSFAKIIQIKKKWTTKAGRR